MNTNPKEQLMQLMQTASPAQLLESPLVADRFKDLYKIIHGIKNTARAEAYYTAEKFHFLKLVSDSTDLQSCTKLSLYGVFMDMAVSGLSFDPSMKHAYVYSYNINVGTQDQARWEKRASLNISPYGELLLRTLQGQIKYADNVILVFEGDDFKFGTRDNKTIVEHMACIPRKTDNIIASYVKITRHDDSIDYKVFATEDILRLKKFSKSPNSKAWTDGFPGMVQAKTIKHAFKTYPKIRIGEFSKLASETVDEVAEDVTYAPVVDYGIPEAAHHQNTLNAAPVGADVSNLNVTAQPQGVFQNANQKPEELNF